MSGSPFKLRPIPSAILLALSFGALAVPVHAASADQLVLPKDSTNIITTTSGADSFASKKKVRLNDNATVTLTGNNSKFAPQTWLYLAGNEASFIVEGKDTKLTTAELLIQGGPNTLVQITKAGQADITKLNLDQGELRVDGAGAVLSVKTGGTFRIGYGKNHTDPTRKGTLIIKDGAKVTSEAALTLTNRSLDSAVLRIEGANALLEVKKTISSGHSGTVDISLLNGGKLTSKGVTLGKKLPEKKTPLQKLTPANINTVLIQGKDSSWTNSDDSTFELHRNVRIRLADQGTLDLNQKTLAFKANASLTIGGQAGGAPEAAGILKAKDVAFSTAPETALSNQPDALIPQTLIFNHTATTASGAYHFAPVITGFGTIENQAGDTVLSATDQTLGGNTIVSGGSLDVGQTKLSGTVSVKNGGQLISHGKDTLRQPGNEDPARAHGTTVTIDGKGSLWRTNEGLAVPENVVFYLTNQGELDLNGQPLKFEHANTSLVLGHAGNGSTPGILSASSVQFSETASTAKLQRLNFSHQGRDDQRYVFSLPISGKGNISQNAGEVVLVGDSSAFSGTTTVMDDGFLQVNGKLGGTLLIEEAATLGGHGEVGSSKIAGTLRITDERPLTVNGDLTLDNKAKLNLTLSKSDAPKHALLNVNGKATLGTDTELNITASKQVTLNTPYVLLKAKQVEGKFGQSNADILPAIDNQFAFLKVRLDYSNPTQIGLTLERKASFASQAAGSNGVDAANAIEKLPTNSALYQYVLTLPKDTPAAVFDSLSGDAHTPVNSALQLSAVSPVQQVPLAKLRTNLHAGLLPGEPLAQSGNSYPIAALPSSAAQPMWAQVVGSWQKDKGDNHTPSGNASTGGLFIGGDHALDNGIRIGAAVGVSRTHVSIRDRAASAGIDNYSLTLYGGKQWPTAQGQWNLSFGGAYILHRVESQRTVVGPNLQNVIKANYRGNSAQLFSELGHAFTTNNGYFEPYAALSFNRLSTQSYAESGGITALNAMAQSSNTLVGTFGLRGVQVITSKGREARLRAGLAWRYSAKDITPSAKLAFQGGPTFTVSGTPVARSALQLELGIDAAITPRATLGVGYTGDYASGSQQHTAMMNARWAF